MALWKKFLLLLSFGFYLSEAKPIQSNIPQIKTQSSVGCNYGYCKATTYGAFGDLTVDDPNHGTISTFGGKADAQATGFGAGASADGHLVHVSRGGSFWEYEGNILKGKAGVYASSLNGVGAMVDATLAEFGGKLGKGPLSIGGKAGLSGTTGFRIGPTTEVKVLGTGFSFGYENGFEVCLFGSCLSVG